MPSCCLPPSSAASCLPTCLQFEIAHTTLRYSKVLAAVGPEVVSSQDRLNKVRSGRYCPDGRVAQERWSSWGCDCLALLVTHCADAHGRPSALLLIAALTCLPCPALLLRRSWSCCASRWHAHSKRRARRFRRGASMLPCSASGSRGAARRWTSRQRSTTARGCCLAPWACRRLLQAQAPSGSQGRALWRSA